MALEQPSPPTFQTPEKAAIPRGELAYRQIRDAIQSGRLTPGTRMREVEVAQWLGTSRTPVREALGRLLNDGLVANDPNRGMIVTELDHQMVDELYVMREVLEGTAAGLAARNATESEIAMLRRLAEKDRTIGDNPAELSSNNKSFHDTLYQSAHNRYLLKTLSTLRESMALLGHTTLALPGRSSTAINEHEEIVSAIEKRDAEAAEAAARSHIRAAYKARMKVLFEEKG
ncbi:GntR family transcriptional regulator [Noviherbaspirillum sp.]|uniref:GntR family transcriptional regulator n=1 Tax=Noviherbaspirillum sp. TaxID=1926288 RepID=UPI002D6E3DCD|nr:GntR family transcriptional regulator [Noviherbaspirillum sp.]HZW21865.1 GntR family transcriptional regulator [Noviherbaspirillum sp.]